MTYDLTIIGGGIVGLATAWQIQNRRPNLHIAILEKENQLATHQTDRNSGVIHSGIYYTPGSAKAVNCVTGYRMLLRFCDDHEIPYELCGKVIAATRSTQLAGLDRIFDRGLKNNLQGIRMLESREVQEIEPHCRALRGIWVPQAGIIDYRQVADKLAALLREGGADIITGFPVTRIASRSDYTEIEAENRVINTRYAIACAGLYSDRLARAAGLAPPHRIVPFRGEFYQLTPEASRLVRGLIYPVPDPGFPFLGVHLTKRITGGVEAGPNAVLAFRREGYRHLDLHVGELSEVLRYPGFQKLALRHWRKGLDELHRSFSTRAFLRSLQELVPELRREDIRRSRTGVRAQALDRNGQLVDDYVVLRQDRVLHLLNAPSPAATSCLSIGENMADRFFEMMAIA